MTGSGVGRSQSMKAWIRQHQLIAFLVIAFGVGYLVWIPAIEFIAVDGDWHVVMFVGGFGPWLSAVLVVWAVSGGSGVRRWFKKRFGKRIGASWYLMGWFVMPLAVGALHLLLYMIAGGRPDFSRADPWLKYVIGVPIAALIAGGNEEPGWRGFALPVMLKRLNPLAASLLLGVIWSAWHIPLFWLPGWGGSDKSFPLFLFSVAGLSVIMTWLFYRSCLNVIPVMLFHQATNQVQNLFPTPDEIIPGIDDWQILRGIVYWIFAVVLLVVTRGRLGYSDSDAPAEGGKPDEQRTE
jgi:membrane protease YdiL (CAAX protease family)